MALRDPGGELLSTERFASSHERTSVSLPVEPALLEAASTPGGALVRVEATYDGRGTPVEGVPSFQTVLKSP
jgi:hypothetical protein